MDDELELPEAVDDVLDPGIINISQRLGAPVRLEHVLARVNHHFRDSGLGYQPVSGDTFKLKIRSRRYPLFGVFTGKVHVIEHVPFKPGQPPTYRIEGLLRFRLSIVWFLAVVGFFFLLVYLTKPGLFLGAFVEALGSGITIYTTYQLGRAERDAVEERIHASFLRLRSTFGNLR